MTESFVVCEGNGRFRSHSNRKYSASIGEKRFGQYRENLEKFAAVCKGFPHR